LLFSSCGNALSIVVSYNGFEKMDAQKTLAEIREKRALTRKKRHSRSKLDKFTFEILELKNVGATLSELQLFLRQNRVKVELSTISRWLKKHG